MRNVSPWLAATFLAATLVAPAAQAQSKKELVNKILALQKPQYEQFGSAFAQAAVGQMLQQAGQALRVRVAEDKREAVAKSMDAEFKAYMQAVAPALRASAVKSAPEVIGTKLEANFNEAELKQLIGYLESPVIRRYNELGAEFQQGLGQKVAAENKALLEAKAKGLAQKFGELLEAKAPGAAPGAAASAASKP